jgi:hypothetical protein
MKSDRYSFGVKIPLFWSSGDSGHDSQRLFSDGTDRIAMKKPYVEHWH